MKQKRSHIGCLFWVALILLLLVVFLFNRPKIDQFLQTTGITSLIARKAPEQKGPNITRTPISPQKSLPEKSAPPVQPGGTSQSPASQPAKPESTKVIQQEPSSPGSSGSSGPLNKKIVRRYDLYFVRIDAGGRPVLSSVRSSVDFVDSPLTRTFDTLLEGVPPRDRSDGLRSLIPEGTRLLSASVRDGTAFLDFNDRFRFNAYGVEGYNAQLAQVVYTATQFHTVKRVQILLDGKVRKFLAPEGIAIDKPLDRGSFAG